MMALSKKLVVAISSRALFDLNDSHEVYINEGVEAYRQYQIDHEDDVLPPGSAFHLAKKLTNLNRLTEGEARVEVILLSRNSADTGLRVFNSIQHWQLPITRAAFCGGVSPYRYVKAFGAHLFLSGDHHDVSEALSEGYAAARIVSASKEPDENSSTLKIAFDGDAVLFSDESERIFNDKGLDAFTANEVNSARTPLTGGPFKSFLSALHELQSEFSETDCPIRTALVTARSAPAHERVVRTLRGWNIRIDESIFLGGLNKAEFLSAFGADVFFDDQEGSISSASKHVTAGHVIHGVKNEK